MGSIKRGYINFVPACSQCGNKINEIVNYEELPSSLTPYGIYKQFQITPSKCPYCNVEFQSIVMPIQLPWGGQMKEVEWDG